MIYLVCFLLSLLILLWVITSDRNVRVNAILLALVTSIGDGGYYALIQSTTLEEALLANALTYTIGIFAPMLFLFNICDICKITLPNKITIPIYFFQLFLFSCVCTTDRSDLFYKTVEIHKGLIGTYLTKTYGPLHTVYLIAMGCFFFASIIIAFHFSRKRNVVSAQNVDFLIFIFFLLVGAYAIERLIHLKVELIPFIYTIGILGVLIPVAKITKFAIENNKELIENSMENVGYIVLSNRLLYMDSNEYAKELFPELSEWEKEQKIPGNGGRFNTFLRPALTKYVESNQDAKHTSKSFSIREESYNLELSRLHKGRKAIGYVIKFTKG